MREGMRRAYAQYTSNLEMAVFANENTTESRSSIMEKRNPHQS